MKSHIGLTDLAYLNCTLVTMYLDKMNSYMLSFIEILSARSKKNV